MSGIARVKEKMKRKIAQGMTDQVASSQQSNTNNQARKVYLLSQEDNALLRKIFSKRLNFKNETSVSRLMSEAIELLYCKEFPPR